VIEGGLEQTTETGVSAYRDRTGNAVAALPVGDDQFAVLKIGPGGTMRRLGYLGVGTRVSIERALRACAAERGWEATDDLEYVPPTPSDTLPPVVTGKAAKALGRRPLPRRVRRRFEPHRVPYGGGRRR
jgi:hypothetical protein